MSCFTWCVTEITGFFSLVLESRLMKCTYLDQSTFSTKKTGFPEDSKSRGTSEGVKSKHLDFFFFFSHTKIQYVVIVHFEALPFIPTSLIVDIFPTYLQYGAEKYCLDFSSVYCHNFKAESFISSFLFPSRWTGRNMPILWCEQTRTRKSCLT